MDTKQKLIVIFVGPPGAGKGTQADMLAEDYGFFHFETSRIIEAKINGADLNDSDMARERELFKSGKLNTPELVEKWVVDKVEELAESGKSIVFSGSPRTLEEAETEMPLFDKLYGGDNIRVFHIEVSEDESVKRNSKRRICEANRHPIPNFPEFKDIIVCPKDGSKLITRVLDTVDTIRTRYQEYLNRTKPILDFFTEHQYEIISINGDQGIKEVHLDIISRLEGHRIADLNQHKLD